jgi:predicted DNA-binding transcriptional regulator AlpA
MNTASRWQRSELSILCDRIESLVLRVEVMQQRIENLTDATSEITKNLGTRLTRTEVLKRLNKTNKTLNKLMAQDRFPRPGRDGHWLLCEIIEWEADYAHR